MKKLIALVIVLALAAIPCAAFAETIKNVQDGSCVGFVVHGGVIMAIMEAYARPKKDFYAYHIGNGECLQGVYDGETIQIK